MTSATSNPARTRTLLAASGPAVLLAALATTSAAGLARSGDVPLSVGGELIPLPAFAMWTLLSGLVGIVMARLLRRRSRFLAAAGLGTALSLLPPIALPEHASTRAVLVLTHLLAAGIIVPALARRLPARPQANDDRVRSANS